MTDHLNHNTVAPQTGGVYQKVATVVQSSSIGTNVRSQQIRTVTTTATKGHVTLRYTPREQSDSRNTNS